MVLKEQSVDQCQPLNYLLLVHNEMSAESESKHFEMFIAIRQSRDIQEFHHFPTSSFVMHFIFHIDVIAYVFLFLFFPWAVQLGGS